MQCTKCVPKVYSYNIFFGERLICNNTLALAIITSCLAYANVIAPKGLLCRGVPKSMLVSVWVADLWVGLWAGHEIGTGNPFSITCGVIQN